VSEKEERAGRVRYVLTRPYVRVQLQRDLALGQKTQSELAADYGVTQSAISQFALRWRVQIQRYREDMADEFAGLWAAKKSARVAVYQGAVELLDDQIEALESGRMVDADALRGLISGEHPDGPILLTADVSDILARLLKARDRALRSIAEELGQLPSRVQVTVAGEKATLRLEGVDVDKL
jgi:hypothetical protein